MSNRSFCMLLVLWMMLLAVLMAGGCGGSSSNNLGVVEEEPMPIPTPSGYTVTFDSQGGSFVASQTVSQGSAAEAPNDPQKDECAFMGWYTSEGFSFRFDFSTLLSRDITLYAKWWDINDKTDSDNDGMPDLLEITYGTDPDNPDTDNDGLTDWDEINWLGYNPLVKDTDGNGVMDGEEDPDNDGLTNIQEGNYGTSMIAKDTDHDGLSDGDEVKVYSTDPLNPDTDGDGVDDGTEVAIGSDPLTPETAFITTIEADYTSSHPEAADLSIVMTSSADAAGHLSVSPASYSDSPFVSRYIPGYITAWNIETVSSFDKAEITFTLGNEAGEINDNFQPAIYCLDEDTGIFRKVEGQRVEGRKIIAEVSHFSIYALLNSRLFDEVWSEDIRPPSSINTQGNGNLDIVFVIDYSVSMTRTDPNRLAVELPKNFVAKLREGRDKVGIVQFATTSNILLELTPIAQSPDIIAALDGIAYNGSWTNGANGLHDALDITDKSSAEFKYIIFLTDGDDTVGSPYSYSDLIDRASQSGVIVYTIGTGTANETTLKRIATGTGGAYYAATTSGTDDMLDLEEIYEKIEKEAEAMRTDSNNDGISDYYTNMLNDGSLTINGVPLFAGLVDNDSDDWDGDGLKNNEEIIVSVDAYGKPYVHMKSNPTLVDTDLDGYSDYQEVVEMGTSPLKYTMLPGDFDQLRRDSIYPIEYRNYSLPGNDNFFVNLMENFVKVFAGDQQKRARDAFIDYFYKYSTTTEVLSRDAGIAEKMIQNQDIIDGIHLASSFVKMLSSVIDFCDNVGSDTYTASGQAKERAKTMRDEADKAMAKVLGVKKKDVDRLNQMWFQQARSKIPYARQKAEVSAFREEFSNILDSVNSVLNVSEDFAGVENGKQWWAKTFDHASGAFAFFSTGIETLATFNKIEIPCKWSGLKKLSDLKGSKGGKIFSGTITVAVTAADTVAECLSVANTYGKIAANYAEYQKYLDLLRHIENNYNFPDYVRKGAAEIAEMFDAGGEPDWDEFDSRLQAAINREINAGVFQAIIDITGTFFPVVKQVDFVYKAAKTSGELLGVALLAKTMIEAEIYYSIADGSRTLFNRGVNMVAGYFESIKESTDSAEAGKYAVQLAQARIVGLDSVRSLVESGKAVEWVARLIAQAFTGRTDEVIKKEYNDAINRVYDVARKCGMILSGSLPTAK